MVESYAVFGASGFGREVIPLVRQSLKASMRQSWELVFVDDAPASDQTNGIPTMKYVEWLERPVASRHACIAIANSRAREDVVSRCNNDNIGFFQVRASNVVELDAVQIGDGAILCPFVTLTSNVIIGRFFQANIYSYVAHDCIIGDFVTFAPRVHCNGNVHIHAHAYIGTAAIIRQGRPGEPIVIGAGAVVGMGAVVTKSVADGATVIGNPARNMKRRHC